MQLLKSKWKGLPTSVRKPMALVVGFSLIVLGAALVVVPGPFTAPPILAGLAVLSTEFAWAKRALHTLHERYRQVRAWTARTWRRLRKQD